MSIELENLSDLDPAEVQQRLELLIQRIQEANPTLDLKRGVFHDLVALLHATLSTAEQETFKRYLSARSLKAIEEDPTLADEGVVDDLLSNYRLVRQAGSSATGEVVVVVSSPNTVTISSGAVFTANGKQFATDDVFTGKLEAARINSTTDRLMTQLQDGNYAFTVTVTASEAGTESVLKKDTLLIPSTPPRDFVTAYAASDFTDGRSAETNQELLDRLQQGLATRAPSNRLNMQAMLREQFPNVSHSSIVGFGDAEMVRDQHTIWPGSLGGHVDWYIRTQERLYTKTLTKTCTLLSLEDGAGTWQFNLGRDEAPGFYEVASIRPLTSSADGTLTLLSDVRSVDLTGGGFVPDIDTVEEGAYSRYQTAVVQFVDDVSDHSSLSVGDTLDYYVQVAMLPLISDIQDTFNARDTRSYGADLLVKAPVPCFMQLSFTIHKQSSEPDPDLTAIQNALAEEVNSVRFVGRLYASQLHDVIHGHLANATSVSAIDMFGRLRYPDGSRHYIRSSEVLTVPDDSELMVSSRTVQLFLDPSDVAITVKTTVPE